MMIYAHEKVSKKYLKNKKYLKQLEEEKEWLKSLEPKTKSVTISKKSLVKSKRPNLSMVPPGRETPVIPSRKTGGGLATKPVYTMYYTGDKMKGIGTLHKSNAVPIFTDEEARDQATMRR